MPDPGDRGFSAVREWPPELRGFEDLAFLFTSGQLNHGVASLAFDEAAHLYRAARDLGPATIVEIGRFRGGSTLVLATAMDASSRLHSYDLLEPDPGLVDALGRYGLSRRVQLQVGDSRTLPPPDRPCELAFVDGDHTYEGVRADYERWKDLLAPGGHLLFHDAVDRPPYGSYDEPVARVVAEIERDPGSRLTRTEGAGSIAHFLRSG